MPIKAVRSVKFPALIKTTGAITVEKTGSEFTFDFDPLQCIPYDVGDAIPYVAGVECNPAPKATVVTNDGYIYVFIGTDGYVTPPVFDPAQWVMISAPGTLAAAASAAAAAAASEASAVAAAASAAAAASVSTEMPRVATRAGLAALATSANAAILLENGWQGVWTWDSLVSIATHQADTKQLYYVAPNAAATGAWVRETEVSPLKSNRGKILLRSDYATFQNKTPIVSALPSPSSVADGYEAILVGGSTPIRVYCDGAKHWDMTSGAEIVNWWLPPGAIIHWDFANSRFYHNGSTQTISAFTDHGDGSFSIAYTDTGSWWGSGNFTLAIDYVLDFGADPAGHIFGWYYSGANFFRVEVQNADSAPYTRRWVRGYVAPTAVAGEAIFPNQNTPGQSVIIEGRHYHRALFSVPSIGTNKALDNGNFIAAGTSVNGSIFVPNTFRIKRNVTTGVPATGVDVKSITIWPTAFSDAQLYRYNRGGSSLSPPVHLIGDSFLEFHFVKEGIISNTLTGYVPISQDGVGSTTLAQQATRFEATPLWWDATLVIVDGALELDGQSAIEAINRMVSKLTHNRFLYVQSNPIHPIGDSRRTDWVANQGAIRGFFGEEHYLETLAPLQALGDGGANDNADIAAGIWPRSLRGDATHLTQATRSGAYADLIYAKLDANGWL
jgi:hypothetical protein